MALVDRNTGLPAGSAAANNNFGQTVVNTSGRQSQNVNTQTTERTSQNTSGGTSSVNTTPTALAALDALITQLMGSPGGPALTAETIDSEIPLLVARQVGGYQNAGANNQPTGPMRGGTTVFFDPKTGKQYSKEAGAAENAIRMQQREQRIAQGAIAPTPGGTPEMRQQQENRQREIESARGIREDYSKDEAFSDSQALITKSINDALSKVLPQITLASEGSGASTGSMRALLTQKAAENAGIEGAALGAQTAVAYGGIQSNLTGILEALTRSDPNSPAALLLNAIIGSKGLISDNVTNQNTTGTVTRTQEQETETGPTITIQDTMRQMLDPLATMNGIFKPVATDANVAVTGSSLTTNRLPSLTTETEQSIY